MNFIKCKYATCKEYFSSQDTQQRISVTTSFCGDGFRVIMASLLCIFIPQGCTQTSDNRSIFDSMFGSSQLNSLQNQINGTTNTLQICTFTENIFNLIDFNVFVLAFNFFTLTYFIYLYYVELRRESWLINTLDYDNTKNEDNIETLKEHYPEVMNQLQTYNYTYMKTYQYLQYIYVVNFVSSAVLVLYYYYFDYRTATALCTNIVLCWSKISNGKTVSKESYKNERAYSYFNIKHLSFNTIDPKYKKDDNNFAIETDLDLYNVKKNIQNIKKYIQTF